MCSAQHCLPSRVGWSWKHIGFTRVGKFRLLDLSVSSIVCRLKPDPSSNMQYLKTTLTLFINILGQQCHVSADILA